VVHDRHTVGAEMHVELDAVAGITSSCERLERVLTGTTRRMQPAVRERVREPSRRRREVRPAQGPP
jgi:hypothetical protein